MMWFVELFIWLLILILVSNGIMFFKYNYRKNFNTYQIFLNDVDGLINGSPVKLLGIQIGYVNQLDIVGEDVYVKFIVTDPKVKIPAGSTATVEFSGLGGSKSLEIYPPKPGKEISNKFITPQQPKRIHDCLGLLYDMVDKLVDITYDFSHFMDEIGLIKNKKRSNNIDSQKTATEFLDFSDNWLDKAQGQSDKIHKKIEKVKGKRHGKHYGESSNNEQQQCQSN